MPNKIDVGANLPQTGFTYDDLKGILDKIHIKQIPELLAVDFLGKRYGIFCYLIRFNFGQVVATRALLEKWLPKFTTADNVAEILRLVDEYELKNLNEE